MAENTTLLTYKGKPLMRKDNVIYYGSMADKYIIMLQILDSEKSGDIELSGRIAIYLQLTDENVRPKDRIVRKSEKKGLFSAMDIASIWLTRALAEKL